MYPIVNYAILDDVGQTVVLTENWEIATAHFNDINIVINHYDKKIKADFDIHNTREYLDNGRRYWKELKDKKEVDKDVINSMLYLICGEGNFKKDETVECFCDDDLKSFIRNKK